MRSGDVIVNIDGYLVVKFKGHIAGRVSTYTIETKDGIGGKSETHEFTGTAQELLVYCSHSVKIHNDHVFKSGGTLI